MTGFFGAGGMGGNVERHIGDDDRDGAAIEALQPGGNGMTHAARDVLAERQRQIEVEGWTHENDDAYRSGDMADAAACYAMTSPRMRGDRSVPLDWPWVGRWWKPTDRRRNLVKAGALILAEIERLDRMFADKHSGEAKGAEPLSLGRVKVPEGQTPLNDTLGHRLLDVFNEGIKARDAGTGSPYHGHSLEGCIHAAGWVQRDLHLALNSAHAALQPGEAQGADPVAWQIKPLAFDWQPKDRGNPSEMIIQTDDYSAYVLIPYDKGHDPRAGIGTWNGVANHKGETGFPTREAAMRYCEDTIRADAERAVKKAMRWIEATPPAAQVTVADTIAALKAMPTRTEALGGQDFKYIQLGEALDTLRALAGAGHPSRTGRRRQMKALIVGGPNRGQVVDVEVTPSNMLELVEARDRVRGNSLWFKVEADVQDKHGYVMRELARAYEFVTRGETRRQHVGENGKL